MFKGLKINKNKVLEWLFLIITTIIAYKTSSLIWSMGLPNYPNVDETITISRVKNLYENKTMILDYFKYPGLNFYYGKIFLDIITFIFKFDISSNLNLIIRYIYTSSALISFMFFYFAMKNIFGKKFAYISFILSIFSLYYYRYIYYAGPDTLIIAFSNILIYISSLIYINDNEEKDTYFFIPLFCIFLGLTLSVKYNGVIFVVLLIFLYIKKRYYRSYKNNFLLLISLILMVLTFVICNFCMFIDFNKFMQDVIFNFNHYKAQHQGLDCNAPLIYYLKIFFKSQYGVLGLLFSMVGIYSLIKNKKYVLLCYILIVPITTIILLSKYNLALERNISTIIQFNIILICYGMVNLCNVFRNNKNRIIISIVMIFVLANITIISYLFFNTEESLNMAAIWINDNIPEHSTINLVKSDINSKYLPLIDENKYIINDALPNQLKENEYLITSEYRYGRLYKKNERLFGKGDYMYPDNLKSYEYKISNHGVIKQFYGITNDPNISFRNDISYLNFFKYDRSKYYIGPTVNIYVEK